jgi:hypothetical protein
MLTAAGLDHAAVAGTHYDVRIKPGIQARLAIHAKEKEKK